jgi:hypothetical protein
MTAEDLRTITATTTPTTAAPPSTTAAPTTTTPPRTTAAPTTTASTVATTTTISATSSTTAAPVTTLAQLRRYAAVEPTYRPPSQPGVGDHFGSGCAPGVSYLPDGVWLGRIERPSASEIDFDLMCLSLPDENDVAWITNTNPALRTVPVAPAAIVHRLVGHAEWVPTAYARWYRDPQDMGFCPPNGCWDAWLFVNDGTVTEIVQMWID